MNDPPPKIPKLTGGVNWLHPKESEGVHGSFALFSRHHRQQPCTATERLGMVRFSRFASEMPKFSTSFKYQSAFLIIAFGPYDWFSSGTTRVVLLRRGDGSSVKHEVD